MRRGCQSACPIMWRMTETSSTTPSWTRSSAGHAVAGRDREPRVVDLALAGAVLELEHRFGDTVETAGRPAGLAGGEHAAPGVERKSSLADVAAAKAREV